MVQPCGNPDSGSGGPDGAGCGTGSGVGVGATTGFDAATGVGGEGMDEGAEEGIVGADFTEP